VEELFTPVQTVTVAHAAALTMGIWALSPGAKRQRRGVDHQPPSRAEVKERVELYLFSISGLSWYVQG
jgi:hypothetical protein